MEFFLRHLFRHTREPEVVRMGVVAAVGIAVYAAAAFVLWRRIRRHRARRRGVYAVSRLALGCERVILVAAAMVSVATAYGYFVEPYWPQITRIQLRLPPRLAATLPCRTADAESLLDPTMPHPVRLVQISDLHCVDRARLDARIPQLVAALQPDLIFFTGDGLNDLDAMPQLRSCMTRLAEIAPVYCVKGNWDMTWFTNRNLYGRFGCQELDGSAVKLRVNGVPLCIAGASADDGPEMRRALRALDHSAYCVFLYHYPDALDAAYAYKPDLYLAGHTHGGQIALPFYGALVTKSRFGKRFESGRTQIGDTVLYVNRGIGMDYIPVRFCARPEITVFNLIP